MNNESQSQPTPSQPSSSQVQLEDLQVDLPDPDPNPTPQELAKYGIKVRDFGYESTLPPVRSVKGPQRKYIPEKQIQPGPEYLQQSGNNATASGSGSSRPSSKPRPLKRHLPDGTEVDTDTEYVMGVPRHRARPRLSPPENDAERPRKLRRTETAAVDQASLLTRRENALSPEAEAALRAAAAEAIGGSQPSSGCSQSQGYSQHSYAYYSQQSGEDVPTPPLTPNGSLQWNPDSPLVPTEPASEDCSRTFIRTPSPPPSPSPAPRRISPLPRREGTMLRREGTMLHREGTMLQRGDTMLVDESAFPLSESEHCMLVDPRPAPASTTSTPTPPGGTPHTPTAVTPPTPTTPPPNPRTHSGSSPLARSFSSLSTLSSPPPSQTMLPPPRPRTPTPPPPPPRYQLRRRANVAAPPPSPVRSPRPRGRPPPPRREESLPSLVIQS
ncbi:hypothetical protein R3P38DRAFT_3171778 [Favolaschia claudopus]|uniref:Uncharacterized protein n=1 Tax=Favolaschia claudopus TaxID=2862362 RepID=A0AAW0DRK0_9AGAR